MLRNGAAFLAALSTLLVPVVIAARLSLKSTDITSLHNTALAVARSNPRLESLRFFVGYSCDPDHPFNCLFSTCQPDGMCGCNANETVFLGMMCLPARRLGESCIDTQQCRKSNRNSKCDVPRSLTVGMCKCLDGSMKHNGTCNRALGPAFDDPDPKDAIEMSRSKSCVSNHQCARFGKNAECKPNGPTIAPEPVPIRWYMSVNQEFLLSGNLFMQTCECKPGYRMDDKERQCRNIDECTELPPQETCRGNTEKDVECINTEGSFDCFCRSNKGRLNGRAPSGICCSETQIPCDRDVKCVDITAVCDGFPDCSNGYDENFDFCIKPKTIPVNDTMNSIPSRAISFASMDPVDPMPYAQI